MTLLSLRTRWEQVGGRTRRARPREDDRPDVTRQRGDGLTRAPVLITGGRVLLMVEKRGRASHGACYAADVTGSAGGVGGVDKSRQRSWRSRVAAGV
jgi:hypothetical protein